MIAHDTFCLTLRLRPGTRPLTAVLSTLHTRNATVLSLSYAVLGNEACVVVECHAGQADIERLAAQLNRRVDVLSISTSSRPAPTT